jgi:hypothetical protein
MNGEINNCTVIKAIMNVDGMVMVNLQHLDKCILYANSLLDYLQLKKEMFYRSTDFSLLKSIHSQQGEFHLCILSLGIARPQSQFPHLCDCERFIYFQDRSTHFLQQNRKIDRGNI